MEDDFPGVLLFSPRFSFLKETPQLLSKRAVADIFVEFSGLLIN
jgi:hypothetical protein